MKEVGKPWWHDSLFIFVKVSTWIAVPVIVGLFAGRALDKHFGTKPWLFLATIGFAFFITIIGIYKTTGAIMKAESQKPDETVTPKT